MAIAMAPLGVNVLSFRFKIYDKQDCEPLILLKVAHLFTSTDLPDHKISSRGGDVLIKLSLKFVLNCNFNPKNQHTEHNSHKLKRKEPAQKSVAVYSFRLPKIIRTRGNQPLSLDWT